MKFAPGEVLVRRFWRGGQLCFLNVLRVVADDERGLRLWLPLGSPYWRLVGSDGRTLHDTTIDALPNPRLKQLTWLGSEFMIWMPADRPYSVWWRWADGGFAGWYVNLEEPYVRWADRGCAGVDTADHALDLEVRADHSWRWKDDEEFQAKTGHPLYWTDVEAHQIRGTGERLARMAEAAEFPFDGTWTGFRPDAAWTLPGRPPGWDRPRAQA